MQRTVSPAVEDAPAAPATPPAVVVDHLSKHFRLPHRRYNTLKERVLHPWQTRSYETLRAVDDVSFEIQDGEFFGIVGRNGSGKSTLLKCVAGIYDLTSGDTTTRGRVSPFIELGVGFSPELTARDNVIINAIMLGLTRRQAYERFDEIIAFAELQNFLDLKLKNYSSGMAVRLAFSVAVQVDADILLVDEVLAVGDASFQQKCFDKFYALKKAGKTIVFVTHDMSAVQRFCDRALLLEHGELVQIGDPYDVAAAYNRLNFGQLPGGGGLSIRGDRAAEIRGAWFEDGGGERITMVERGQAVVMCAEIVFHEAVAQPRVHFHLRNQAHHTVFASSTELLPMDTGDYAAGESAVFRLRLMNWFTPGRYDLSPTLAAQDAGAGDALDVRENIAAFAVPGSLHFESVVELPHTIDVERRP